MKPTPKPYPTVLRVAPNIWALSWWRLSLVLYTWTPCPACKDRPELLIGLPCATCGGSGVAPADADRIERGEG